MEHIYIVAEIGCNHNGDIDLAYKMIDEAKSCGVDAVKFQTFNAELLISKFAPKAEYQIKNTGSDESQLEMTKKLELSHENYIELSDYARSQGLEVFSTAFEEESIDFLYSLGQSVWKIPSGEITNYPYLKKIANLKIANKKIILSTGMSTIEEITNAIEILAKDSESEITILHCNTEYPTEDDDVNVSAIKDLQKHFPNYKIGFSDHSRGYVAPILAVALGVNFIEKHFTLDMNLPGPDHKASITPTDLKILCESVRRSECMLGSGTKFVTESEKKNKEIARKSIVARHDIKKGEKFSVDNLVCKRPGCGISPVYWEEILGKEAAQNFSEDELIQVDGFHWEQ